MVSLNILSEARTHSTHSCFSVPVIPYFNAVSARVVGAVIHLADAFISILASSAVGFIAVL